jgi:hypothetical protein
MVFPSTCYYYCCTAASVARCIREGVALNDRLRNGATKIMPDADVVVTFVWYNTGLCQVSLDMSIYIQFCMVNCLSKNCVVIAC